MPGSHRPPLILLFDSSFLIAVMVRPTPWQGDLLERVGAYRPVILESVRAELFRLSMGGDPGRSRFASLVLSSLVDTGFVSVRSDMGGKPDDEILSQAIALRDVAHHESRVAVATIDADLIARLRASWVTTVTLRSGRISLLP